MNAIATCSRQPWNKGKLVGQKTPLRLRDMTSTGLLAKFETVAPNS